MMKQFTAYIFIFSIALLITQEVMAQAEKDSTILGSDTAELNLIGIDSNLPVPVGYEMSRSTDELISAVGVVRAHQLETNGSVINPENLFYGKISGLMTIANGGKANTAPRASFYIRGRESFRSSAPLILLDGLKVSDIKTLSPNAIESVSVLKDAAATAMYGTRGANGVILITTKRGAEHPLKVNFNYNQSITQPVGLPNMLGAPQYARALNEARVNDGLSPRYSPHDLNEFDSGNSPYLFPNVDWFDEVFRDYGTRSNMNVTFKGGSSIVRYFALLGYDHYSGIYEPSDIERGYKAQQKYGQLNFRTNLDVDITNNLLLKFNVSSYLYDSNVPSEGTSNVDVIDALYRTPSTAFPVKLPDGTWGGTQIHSTNPVAKYRDTGFGNLNARQLGIDAALQQNLDSWLKGLSAEAKVHFVDFGSYIDGKNRDYKYGFLSAIRDAEGNITDTILTKYGEDTQLDYSTRFNNQSRHTAVYGKLDYSTSFDDSKIDAMVLVQQNSDDYDGTNNLYRYRKIAANIQYGLNEKYFFNVTGSYAGRNQLPKENRYNLFPAVSVGWLLSNEGFLQKASFLDHLKLRASWGIVGNDAIPNNKSYIRSYDYGGGGYYFEKDNVYQAGVIENDLPSSDFRIAKSRKTNLGIDAGFIDQVDLTIDLFYAERSDILTGAEGRYSDVLGIGIAPKSDGIVENKGMEIGVNWQNIIGDFAWSIGGQFTYARNKIVNQDEQYRPEPYLRRTGQQVGQRFGLQAIGLFKDEQEIANSPIQNFTSVKPGDIKYKDQNSDGIIDQYDVVPIGYAGGYPEMYFSASVGFQYKRISLSALFQGTGHITAYLNTESVYWPLGDGNNTISDYYYNRRWTPNTANSATLPRLTTQNNDNNFRSNSIWLKDRSYIMLRNLKLTYPLPVSIVQRLNMDNIEFVARGRNLFSIDHIPVGRSEQYDSSYPLQRYYSLGINVAF